jgi:hypothetical protein
MATEANDPRSPWSLILASKRGLPAFSQSALAPHH